MKAIKTVYKGPTNTRGSRIVASDCDGNRIVLPYDHALSVEELHIAAAYKLCVKMNWKGKLLTGWLGNDAVHVFKK